MTTRPDVAEDHRRPRSVYAVGSEPDPRFSLANERTFLAWIRTALALLALGIALDAFGTTLADAPRRALAAALVALGIACSALAFHRWMASERALRLARPLPASLLAPVVTYGLALLGIAVLVAVAT